MLRSRSNTDLTGRSGICRPHAKEATTPLTRSSQTYHWRSTQAVVVADARASLRSGLPDVLAAAEPWGAIVLGQASELRVLHAHGQFWAVQPGSRADSTAETTPAPGAVVPGFRDVSLVAIALSRVAFDETSSPVWCHSDAPVRMIDSGTSSAPRSGCPYCRPPAFDVRHGAWFLMAKPEQSAAADGGRRLPVGHILTGGGARVAPMGLSWVRRRLERWRSLVSRRVWGFSSQPPRRDAACCLHAVDWLRVSRLTGMLPVSECPVKCRNDSNCDSLGHHRRQLRHQLAHGGSKCGPVSLPGRSRSFGQLIRLRCKRVKPSGPRTGLHSRAAR